MALENADIDKIAILARLQVTPSETSDYANSISSILSLIDQMQQVSTEGIEPLSNPHDASQRLELLDRVPERVVHVVAHAYYVKQRISHRRRCGDRPRGLHAHVHAGFHGVRHRVPG